jgi:hypothetical protein
MATVVEGGEEEDVIDVPRGRPCAPHRREREPTVRPTVLNLGEDAREASRRGWRSRTLGFGWPAVPPPCLAHTAAGTSMTPPCHAPPRLARAATAALCRFAPRSSDRCRASLTPPRSRCHRYEHDTATPRLARAAIGMSMMPPRLSRGVATWSWSPPPSDTRPPPTAGCLRLRLRAREREREREREDAQMKDEVTPHTRGEHEKIRTKWMPRTTCFEFFNRHSTPRPSREIF